MSASAAALDHGAGVLQLAPTWVPRAFCVPGRRIKLHPDDYFSLGGERGGIDERWLSSTVRADNGPLTGATEGLSHAVAPDGELLPFDEVVDTLGPQLIGDRIWRDYGGWPMYSKFFDNLGPLPLHVHHRDHHAALVGRRGKPEAYFFPPQMNNHLGQQPLSYFGLQPGTTAEQLVERLAGFPVMGDNRITELSRGFRIQVGTGWDMPAGVLHAPASVCTYEPQAASDVFAMCECWTSSRALAPELLWKDVPADRVGDLSFIVELLDWEANVHPDFAGQNFMAPRPVLDTDLPAGTCVEEWIVYRSPAFSAKQLTLAPGASVTVQDAAAYGCIAVQGHGRLGRWKVETPTVIRFGELTADEYFVSEQAARQGVLISNDSDREPLVLLKHFGPDNPDNPHSRPLVSP